MGIVSGEGLSGVVLLAGVELGLRLLVIANAISFGAALVLVLLAAPATTSIANDTDTEGSRIGYRQVLADRINTAAAGLNVAATFLLIAPILFLPVFVIDGLHMPTWVPGVLAAFITATAGIGLIFGSRLVRGRRRLRNLEIAAGLCATGCAAFLIASVGVPLPYGPLFLGALMLGIGEAMYAPTADALPAALAPIELRGRYSAVHQTAWGISEAIAPTLGAAFLAVGAPALWLTISGIGVGTALGYRVLERPTGDRDGVAGEDVGPDGH